ncbi:unnamed protein product [Durusdinium trenchii]|uniref:Uncharacterized protein n=2 Tax=Durusdinium trenchii TaxID=1381693 RepID=A0ABP0S428_9DINO
MFFSMYVIPFWMVAWAGGEHVPKGCPEALELEQIWCFVHEDAQFLVHSYGHLKPNISGNWPAWCADGLPWCVVFLLGASLCYVSVRALMQLRSCDPMSCEYGLVSQLEDGSGISVGEISTKLEIVCFAVFMIVDLCLDNFTGIRYCIKGFWAFGPLTLMIPMFSGILCFTYKRWTWTLADPAHQIDGKYSGYRKAGLDAKGEKKPGLKTLLLQVVQLDPLMTAWRAYHDPDLCEREWMVERAFSGVVEGFPSAVLQLYALLCIEQSGDLDVWDMVNVASVLTSIVSSSNAMGLISFKLLPDKKVEPLSEDFGQVQLRILQTLDMFARVVSLVAFGVALRPFGAKMTQNRQWYLSALLIGELVLMYFFVRDAQLTKFRNNRSDSVLLSCVLSFLSVPLLVFPEGASFTWPSMLSLQGRTLCWRTVEVLITCCIVWYRVHIYPAEPHRILIYLTLGSAIAFAAVFLTVLRDIMCRSWFGRPLLPARGAEHFQEAHWAAALNNPLLLRKVPEQLRSAGNNGLRPAHLAAFFGHLDALQVLSELAPHTLRSTDDKGQTPVHAAAYGGQAAVLQALGQTAGDTFHIADAEGNVPAHFAALNGDPATLHVVLHFARGTLLLGRPSDGLMPVHLAAYEGNMDALNFFFHKVSSESFQAQASSGLTPAHLAAMCGHEKALEMLGELDKRSLSLPEQGGELPSHFVPRGGGASGALQILSKHAHSTLSAQSANGRTPAHLAATNGHSNLLHTLHELVPDTLSCIDTEARGWVPAHQAAEFGHEGALQTLHNLVPQTLSTPNTKGQMPAHEAAANGYEQAVSLLQQLVPETLSVEDKDGITPAYVAACGGHCGVLKVLHRHAATTFAKQTHDGKVPVHGAAMQGRDDAVKLLHRFVPDTLSWKDQDGAVPAHLAAAHGHEKTLETLHQLVPETLSSVDEKGQVPAHKAASNGHRDALNVLRRLVPKTLSLKDLENQSAEELLACHQLKEAEAFLGQERAVHLLRPQMDAVDFDRPTCLGLRCLGGRSSRTVSRR